MLQHCMISREDLAAETTAYYVEIKCQLDATEVFIADLIAGCCKHPANRTHNP